MGKLKKVATRRESKGAASKYTISAYREGAELPHWQGFAGNMADRAFEVERMAKMFPDNRIEVRQNHDLKHANTIRWVLVDGRLVPKEDYDEINAGDLAFKKDDYPQIFVPLPGNK